jgi:hypothetical protein
MRTPASKSSGSACVGTTGQKTNSPAPDCIHGNNVPPKRTTGRVRKPTDQAVPTSVPRQPRIEDCEGTDPTDVVLRPQHPRGIHRDGYKRDLLGGSRRKEESVGKLASGCSSVSYSARCFVVNHDNHQSSTTLLLILTPQVGQGPPMGFPADTASGVHFNF